MSETLTRLENNNEVYLHASSEGILSYDEYKAREAVERETILTQEVTPEILHVTPIELIDQAGRNVYAIRQHELSLTQNDFDLAA